MGTTVNQARDSHARRPMRSRAEVLSTCLAMLRLGYDFAYAADHLDMSPDHKGGLENALRRAGCADLLHALRGRPTTSIDNVIRSTEEALAALPPQRADVARIGRFNVPADVVLAKAGEILVGLPVEDPSVVAQRRRDLLAADDEFEPAGRRVRGPGGVIRWVA